MYGHVFVIGNGHVTGSSLLELLSSYEAMLSSSEEMLSSSEEMLISA
jgi:hypothetical protein